MKRGSNQSLTKQKIIMKSIDKIKEGVSELPDWVHKYPGNEKIQEFLEYLDHLEAFNKEMSETHN